MNIKICQNLEDFFMIVKVFAKEYFVVVIKEKLLKKLINYIEL